MLASTCSADGVPFLLTSLRVSQLESHAFLERLIQVVRDITRDGLKYDYRRLAMMRGKSRRLLKKRITVHWGKISSSRVWKCQIPGASALHAVGICQFNGSEARRTEKSSG